MNRRYLLIGDGRLASHLRHYFSQLGVDFLQWSRRAQTEQALQDLIPEANTVLLAISDSAIEPFIKEHPAIGTLDRIHFCGALVTPLAWGAHPLMTFSTPLYSLEEYRSIPFILDENTPNLHELFPAFSNPQYRVPARDRALYHALAVITSNFTYLLAERGLTEFSSRWGIAPDHLAPLIGASLTNALHGVREQRSLLTGPFTRRDAGTIDRHVAALEGHDLQELYLAFTRFFQNNPVERRPHGHSRMD